MAASRSCWSQRTSQTIRRGANPPTATPATCPASTCRATKRSSRAPAALLAGQAPAATRPPPRPGGRAYRARLLAASAPASELNPPLGLHPLLAEGVAHQLHLGYQVGPLQQGRRRAAAGEGHMGELGPQLQPLEHLFHRQIAQLEGHVHFIEHHQLAVPVSQIAAGALPGQLY